VSPQPAAKLDPPLNRHSRIAFDHRALHFNGAAHGVHHAAELHKRSVAGALHDAPVMRTMAGSIRSLRSPRSSGYRKRMVSRELAGLHIQVIDIAYF
jgi:hypothetical protein